MALLVAQLACAVPKLLAAAKLALLVASGVAGLLSLALGHAFLPTPAAPGATQRAAEAKRSTLA